MNQSFSDITNSVYLYPAALVVPSEPTIVHTILGSCVSVCIFDKEKKSGGINHYMLPFWNGQGLPSPKYGNIAIEKLYNKMLQTGSKHSNLVAKIFGGGEVLETINNHFNVGQRNIAIAIEMLDIYKMPVVAQSTGGNKGRKLVFNTSSGEVIQRYVGQNDTK